MLKFFWESIKSGMSMWYGWIAAISTIGPIIAFFISKTFPKIIIPPWAYKYSMVILALSLILGMAMGTYNVYKEKDGNHPIGFATPDQLIGSHLEGLDIRIVDLAREDLNIRNRTLVNCHIYGPAVLYPVSCTFREISFSGDSSKSIEENVNSFFIPIPKTKILQGVIRLEYIDFRNCTFIKIGIMGPESLRKKFIQSISTIH